MSDDHTKATRDPVNWQPDTTPDSDDEPTPRRQWSRLQRAAMAICQTDIGRARVSRAERSATCVCIRDGRTPSRDVPRCAECLDAASAAALILS